VTEFGNDRRYAFYTGKTCIDWHAEARLLAESYPVSLGLEEFEVEERDEFTLDWVLDAKNFPNVLAIRHKLSDVQIGSNTNRTATNAPNFDPLLGCHQLARSCFQCSISC